MVNQTRVGPNAMKQCRETIKFDEAAGAYIAQQVCR